MIELILMGRMALVTSEIILCFATAIVILNSKWTYHNYFAGFISFLWAGGMMALGTYNLTTWPESLLTTGFLEVFLCGISTTLAIYSKGSVYCVGRLLRRCVQ